MIVRTDQPEPEVATDMSAFIDTEPDEAPSDDGFESAEVTTADDDLSLNDEAEPSTIDDLVSFDEKLSSEFGFDVDVELIPLDDEVVLAGNGVNQDLNGLTSNDIVAEDLDDDTADILDAVSDDLNLELEPLEEIGALDEAQLDAEVDLEGSIGEAIGAADDAELDGEDIDFLEDLDMDFDTDVDNENEALAPLAQAADSAVAMGSGVADAVTEASEQTADAPEEILNTLSHSPATGGGGSWAWVVALLVVLAGIGAGLYWWVQNQ